MTKEERQKIYAALAAPFPEEAIERTDGRVTGRGYSTTGIKYQYVVDRLNEVLGVGGYRAHRTMTVKESTNAKGRQVYEALCEIRLELGEWLDSHFIPFAEVLGDGGHMAMTEADARKGAFTNGFKKAAAMLGPGRDAYRGTLDDDHIENEDPAPARTSPVSPVAPVPRTQAQTPSPAQEKAPRASHTRLTSKQLGQLWVLAQKLNLERGAFRARVREKYGVMPEYLSRDQASELIGTLENKAGNGHAPSSEVQRKEVGP